ncbi:MAG TPA: DUF5931 domain-containing protein [Actinopolymorphaceae bacterium]
MSAHTGDGGRAESERPPEVLSSLWRAIAVPRFVTLAHAVVINAVQWRGYEHPLAGWLVVTGIAMWTLISTWAYDNRRVPKWPVLCADIAVACGALIAGRFIMGPDLLAAGATIPAFWVVSPVLAWAIYRGWLGGVLAGCVVAAADLGSRTHISSETVANVFLTLLAGGVVGYWSTLVRNAAIERARAAEFAARTAERDRIARVVHDGVLQVLAYVQRRGNEIGGETAELARVAGEQEVILRGLVQSGLGSRGLASDPATGEGIRRAVDLVGRLAAVGSSDGGASSISVAVPGTPVYVDADVAEELMAAVRAALDNVERHAAGAKTFLLLEDDGSQIVVSVRDDGPGIPEGRLEEAASAGRMGVSHSIIGRLRDLGGTATLVTGSGQGTEWELRVPRTGASA